MEHLRTEASKQRCEYIKDCASVIRSLSNVVFNRTVDLSTYLALEKSLQQSFKAHVNFTGGLLTDAKRVVESVESKGKVEGSCIQHLRAKERYLAWLRALDEALSLLSHLPNKPARGSRSFYACPVSARVLAD